MLPSLVTSPLSNFSQRFLIFRAAPPFRIKLFKEGYDEAMYKILVEADSAIESAFPSFLIQKGDVK